MKNIKNIIIYGIILLLCVAAFGGYLLNRRSTGTAASGTAIQSTAGTTAGNSSGSAAADGSGTGTAGSPDNPVKASDEIEVSARIITDAGSIINKSEEEKQKHIKLVMSRETEKLDPNPVVGVGRGEDFALATSEAVKNAGGLENIIRKGDVVLIKPNLCVQAEQAGSPMITDYRVVQEVINIAAECGASKIVVAEGNFASNAFENKGNGYVALKGAVLYNFNDCVEKDCYELTPEKSLVGKAIYVPKLYMDADVVINVAKLKTHFITGVSLGLKNCIGVPSYRIYGGSSSKDGLHALGIEQVIIDLNKIRKPEFTIIDGIIGGEDFGPYANTPVKSNVVFAGKDIVAVDAAALSFMGFKPDQISHVRSAAEEKLGIADLDKIKVNGADLAAISMKFKPAY